MLKVCRVDVAVGQLGCSILAHYVAQILVVENSSMSSRSASFSKEARSSLSSYQTSDLGDEAALGVAVVVPAIAASGTAASPPSSGAFVDGLRVLSLLPFLVLPSFAPGVRVNNADEIRRVISYRRRNE